MNRRPLGDASRLTIGSDCKIAPRNKPLAGGDAMRADAPALPSRAIASCQQPTSNHGRSRALPGNRNLVAIAAETSDQVTGESPGEREVL